MKSSSDRLRFARTEKGWSQVYLAERSGVLQQMISKLERGITRPEDSSELYPLATALGARVPWILEESGPVWETGGSALDESHNVTAYEVGDPLPEGLLQIKVSNVRFSGGNGHTATHCEIDEASEPHTYQRSWFVRERLKPERCIRYRLRNDSMEPMLFQGDWILVNLDETSVVDGNTYAFRYADELRVKKMYRRLSGGVLLRSINPAYVDEEVSPEATAEHITIIGRVRDKGGKGGL